MNHYLAKLQERVQQLDNCSVLGLDPNLSYLPPQLLQEAEEQGLFGAEQVAEAMRIFNLELLEATADIIPAVKFQVACYEQYGLAGLACLKQSLYYANELGFVTILDGKRNDIGSSAEAYARAYLASSPLPDGGLFSFLNPDALTVNGYLGWDGVKPFITACQDLGKGLFILVRTSNPSAGDLQDLPLKDGRTVCQAMADLVRSWSDEWDPDSPFSFVGAVVGATWPDQARELRERMPRQIFLIPGYGAQGGGALDALAGCKDGRGGLVNASRSLMLAWQKGEEDPLHFAQRTRQEALRMRQELREAVAHGRN